jgi:glycoprotease/Kae1 family metallohydrolase
MIVVGIESSAHTFGVGIIENGKIIANEKEMFKIGITGMIPAELSEFHSKNALNVIKRAFDSADISPKEIDGVAYTYGPGMGGCLQIGQLSAMALSKKLKIPIVMVNHALAHVEIAKYFAKQKNPIALYVSGGNSQILKITQKPYKHYTVMGETFDIGIGNMLDTLARSMKLNPSWGSTVAKTAIGGRYIEMPYTVKGMDFSFTGLLTKAQKLIGSASNSDICFSVQETAFAMLCETVERAMLLTNSEELCICGGVAQSKRLKEMLNDMASEHNAAFGYAPDEFNSDNGAMIALVGEKMLNEKVAVPLLKCEVNQKSRIDSVHIPW